MSWAKAVGQSLSEHYVKSKGRNMAQSHFLMLMNGQMQGRRPKAHSWDVHDVEALRRELEPLVVAEVRRSYADFSPERWSFWEPWERQGLVRVNESEIDVITFERNAGESRVRYRRLPPPSICDCSW